MQGKSKGRGPQCWATALIHARHFHAPTAFNKAKTKAAVNAHLDSFPEHYSEDTWVPKCRMALHFSEFLARRKKLISCFTHEWKHRLVKRFGNNMMVAIIAFAVSFTFSGRICRMFAGPEIPMPGWCQRCTTKKHGENYSTFKFAWKPM